MNSLLFAKQLIDNRWTLGFIEEPFSNIISADYKVNWLNLCGYGEGWFADPFILDVTDDYVYVLVEEFPYNTRKGRISKLTIRRKGYKLLKVEPILELNTHLSFPAIKRKDEKIFIYPENSCSGKLDLYEYDTQSNKCVFIKTLCNQPLTDAILTDVTGEEIIFSTHIPNQNGDTLSIYKKKGIEFKEEITVKLDSNKARNAGDWFVENGKIFRPAQDCNKRYGGAIIIHEVQVKEGNYAFVDVIRLQFKHKSYMLGCHTFNAYKGLSAIDVNGYRYPLLAYVVKVLIALRNAIKK